QLIAGKYRIERVLGRGGMGVVVAAHHVVLDQVVAIKFLLPEALGSAEAVARFEREARAAVKIQSEHVARVTDVGRLETGAPYMVMELLRGRDLEVLLRERGPLPLTDVADYVLQAGEAIAEAHGLGIVHRDLKPPNLFLTERADGSSCIKVLDFGISKLTSANSSGDQGMTSTSAVMGSPLYMSPEQLMSARDVDMRTDIWALGVICFELLTGKLPFEAETLPQLCMAISLSAPTPLRSYRPDLPLEVEAMVLRCLNKDPGKRYATVAAFAADLVKFAPQHARLSAERIERLARAAGFSASARPLPPLFDGNAAVSAETNNRTQTIGEFGQTRTSASSSKTRWGLGLAVVLAVGGGAAFALTRPAAMKPDAVAVSSAVPVSPATVESSARAENAAPPAAVVPEVAPTAVPSTPPRIQPSASPHAAANSLSPKTTKTNGKSRAPAPAQAVAAHLAAPPAPVTAPPAVKPRAVPPANVFDDR
ncbi:MAG: protein kinase, partial [Polyangiaceae bacterium]